VIPCPDPTQGRQTIDGVAKNGIQLKVKAKVTVRTNIDRAGRRCHGRDDHRAGRRGDRQCDRLGRYAHPGAREARFDLQRVLEKGLDAGTAYEILSIDIADIDVGDNIGANLQALQAEAGIRRVARAKAEERRAFAVAAEQEMIAAVQENAPSSSPPRPRCRLRSPMRSRQGNLGITDYYQLRNVQADTEMRSSIAERATIGVSRPAAD